MFIFLIKISSRLTALRFVFPLEILFNRWQLLTNMKTPLLFSLFYLATFLQAGTYGLTFLLPKLFENLGGNEKHVGLMLVITAATTIVSVYYSGHITDQIGRMNSLGASGVIISISLLPLLIDPAIMPNVPLLAPPIRFRIETRSTPLLFRLFDCWFAACRCDSNNAKHAIHYLILVCNYKPIQYA